MELTDIRSSISEMSDDQLLLLLRDIRQNRRISKRPIPAVKAKVEKAGPDLSTLLAAIPQDKIAALLAQMEANKK